MDDVIRAALFQFEPETSHHVAMAGLQAAIRVPGGLTALERMYAPKNERPVQLLGLTFPNAVGLAAGFDKEATGWMAFGAMGFGHVEIGTVTPEAQKGNPRPRIFRLPDERCLVNRMGFPSEGARVVRERLSHARPRNMVLGVNIGKNKETPNDAAADDYTFLVRKFGDVADYLAVNVSSPNTPGLRALQQHDALKALLTQVVQARDEQVARRGGKALPLLVKFSPDLDDDALRSSADAALEAGIDGIIATNTTLSRAGVQHRNKHETGGLSGAALTQRAHQVMVRLRAHVGPKVPLIGVGGIMNPADAQGRLEAGADLVQVYTGFVYSGPSMPGRIAQRLARASTR